MTCSVHLDDSFLQDRPVGNLSIVPLVLLELLSYAHLTHMRIFTALRSSHVPVWREPERSERRIA